MPVPISPASRELFRSGPIDQAEVLLTTMLASGLDKESMGKLASELFQSGRYSLAQMLFAHWTELEPENPEPWSNLGLSLSRNGQLNEARTVLEYAKEIAPDYAPALNNLCSVYQFLGEHALQLSNARLAADLQPGSSIALNNLGTALMEHGKLAEAKQAFEKSRAIDPGNFEAGFNLARVASDEGRNDEALAFLEAALASPASRNRRLRDMIEYHLSYEYLRIGRLAEGWAFYERGFSDTISPTIARTPNRKFAVPRWDGSPLSDGQRLLIWREQGIGDELRFGTMLRHLDLGNATVIIETDKRLAPMLQRSFPHFIVRDQTMVRQDVARTQADDYSCQVPIGSLPGLLMRDRDVFPTLGGYLKPLPVEVDRFAARFAPYAGKRLVGICWRSHKLSATRNRKYTALPEWEPVLCRPDTVFVNLQYGDCEQELLDIESELGITVLRWPDVDLKDDLEAVLAILHHLDLVITPSTAVLGFAGAMGTPTIYLGHQNWLMLGETDIYPWYASVRPLVVAPTLSVSSLLPDARRLMDELLS